MPKPTVKMTISTSDKEPASYTRLQAIQLGGIFEIHDPSAPTWVGYMIPIELGNVIIVDRERVYTFDPCMDNSWSSPSIRYRPLTSKLTISFQN